MDQHDHESGGRSRQNSMIGSYRIHNPKTQFPRYCSTSYSIHRPAIHCRSLMSCGNGFPPWDLITATKPEIHFQQGVSIGDVGYIDERGGFQYWFNIFYPRDHPIQLPRMPRNFAPIEPPLSEWKIDKSTGNIEPGTILTSEGITYTRTSEQPLEIEFTSYAREGAVLILPEGITREDLNETHKLYHYLKEHASDWYQYLNGYSDEPLPDPRVNSSLIVITGTDKANIWSRAHFPFNQVMMRPYVFQYVRDEHRRFWEQRDSSASVDYSKETGTAGRIPPCALFFRGISIALSKPAWTHGVAPIPTEWLPTYYIPSIPPYGRRADLERFIRPLRRFINNKDDLEGRTIFHPAVVLTQMLLEAAPTAEIAIVEDAVWCSHMDHRSLVRAELIKLVHRILADYEITTTDAVVHFTRKTHIERNFRQIFQQFFTARSLRSKNEHKALRKLKKVLS